MALRVLHVLEAVQFGTVRHLQGVVRHVDAEHVVAIRPPGPGRYTDETAIEQMRADGARLHYVAMRRTPPSPRNIAAIARVRTLIRRSRPDVVHGHSSIGGAVGRLAAVGTSVATCYTPNGLFPSRAAMTLERTLGRVTDRLIASSPSEAQLVASERLVREDRVVIIPNAIEMDLPDPVDLRGRLGIDHTIPVVGNVGRLAPQKAPEIYVRACAQVAATNPEPHFVLVGDGELADLVDREVEAGGIRDRFHLVRMPSGGEAAMAEFDIYAMPSRYEAGNPFSAMEAMRAKVPVILTDVVGNRDAIEHEVSGLLVPEGDPEALAAAIQRLLENPRLRRTIGENGRTRVAARYDLRKVAHQLEDLYESAVRPA